MRRRFALAALVVVLLAWNAALLAAPRGDSPRLSAITYLAGSLICHQQPARSFYSGSAQLPVCARCLGLYTGALFGATAWLLAGGIGRAPARRLANLLQPSLARRALIIAAVPTLATVLTAWAGVWDPSNLVRAIVAAPLGATIAAAVTAVAAGDLR